MKKRFLKNVVPDYRFKKITDIAVDFFGGAELIILDLDNTLVFSDTLQTKPEIIAWVSEIKKRYQCIIFSNSFSFSKRAPQVAQMFGCEVFLSKNNPSARFRARKPFKKLFSQMQQMYHFQPENVFVVGDRIFTDVLFGNINGAKTVLVETLGGKESIFIQTTRILESGALYLMKILDYYKS